MSDEYSKLPSSTSTNILNPLLNYVGTEPRVEFRGSCSGQGTISFYYGKLVNICIVYEINKNVDISSYPTLENGLFGAVKLTKHPVIDQYKYFRNSIEFNRKGSFFI